MGRDKSRFRGMKSLRDEILLRKVKGGGFNFICEADFIRVYSDFIAPRAISLKYPIIYDIISSINENLMEV